MVSFEGFCCESRYRSSEAVTSTIPWQFSGSLFNGVLAAQVFARAALPGPQKAQPRGMRALIIKARPVQPVGIQLTTSHDASGFPRVPVAIGNRWQWSCVRGSPLMPFMCAASALVWRSDRSPPSRPPKVVFVLWVVFTGKRRRKIVVENMPRQKFFHTQQWVHRCREAL